MDKIKRFLKYDLFTLLLDIIIVNASYFLSLVLRFSIYNRLDRSIDLYVQTVIDFSPYYTVACILIFAVFKLYGGVWRYAGINELNRIITANVCTSMVHVVGTLLFFARMPVTYYIMGGAIQLIFIFAVRFAYRLVRVELKHLRMNKAVNALIIGAQKPGRHMIQLLRMGEAFIPTAVIDCQNEDVGKLLEGVPVYGKDDFDSVVKKHNIKAIYIAKENLGDYVESIRDYCYDNDIQFEDYTAFFNYYGELDSFSRYVDSAKEIESNNGKRSIPFSPPDISESEIIEVVETLKSGWITTGPRVKLLERRLAAYIETGDTNYYTESDQPRWSNRVVCLNSATSSEELNLRILGIREGDEVIVPAYTYTSTASAAIHCGATVKFVDICKDGDPVTHMPEMDYEALRKAITPKTKAIIAVDLAGLVCDYDKLFEIAEGTRSFFTPIEKDGTPLTDLASRIQTGLGRVAIVADCAHSLGGSRVVGGTRKYCGAIADFSSFSFHAVKNFTTAEGGASTWKAIKGIDNAEIYKMYQLLSLHGQSKDALAKTHAGAWEYDIVGPWYKSNMTDIMASIGLRQLDRYESLLERRAEIIARYDEVCDELNITHLVHRTETMTSSNHLYIIRIPGIDSDKRNEIITRLSELGVSTNVHYKPLPMMTAYKNLGWDIKDFPNSYDYYHNLITLPLNTKLSDLDVEYVIENLKRVLKE